MIQKSMIQKKGILTALIFALSLSAGAVSQVKAEETLNELENQAATGQSGTAFGYPIPDTYPIASAGDPGHGD